MKGFEGRPHRAKKQRSFCMTIKAHRQINSGGDVSARFEAKISKPMDKSLRHSFFPILSY